jgi:gliding motility-associated-like protein
MPNELIEFEQSEFIYTGKGGTSFEWYVENSSLNNDNSKVYYKFPRSGNYRISLYVENEFLCSDTSSQKVFVNKSRTNSFTPNGDGVNDYWEIEELANYPNYRLWIFDRSGAEVFFSEGYYEAWDGNMNGKQLPQGTYYYVIDYGIDNRTAKGTISILR